MLKFKKRYSFTGMIFYDILDILRTVISRATLNGSFSPLLVHDANNDFDAICTSGNDMFKFFI